MGWLNAVDVIQNFIRRFVFQTCDIPPHLEARKDKPPPKGDAVVVCMDGFDYVRRVNKALSEQVLDKETVRSPEMTRFARECELRKLPLNVGKTVIEEFSAIILGGEVEGRLGWLMHARSKGFNFTCKTLALLSLPDAPQVTLQHWAGVFCFQASFRRPLFSIGHEIFSFISAFSSDRDRLTIPAGVRDEILVAGLLAPLAYTNLRAPLRPSLSISDASEEGGEQQRLPIS